MTIETNVTFSFLQQLNENIEKYIIKTIESKDGAANQNTFHSSEFEPVCCREIKKCTKLECPAYDTVDYRCWLISGTFCGGKPQGEFANKYGTCFKCDVFRKVSEDPIRRIYGNIDILIYHLENRARKLYEIAITDPLTGLYNRHFFNEIIEREIANADRKAETLSFIIIDLDNFKRINDTLGHLTGDRILIETANLIKNTVRSSDLAIRFGGDEFLVFLRDGDCDKSANIVSRLSDEVESWNAANADAIGCRLSFSIGCSICEKKCDLHAALKEADERMYQNKRQKGNHAVARL